MLEIKDQPKGELRLTRTEAKKQKEAMIDGIVAAEEDKNQEGDAIYEMAPEEDIISKFGDEWKTKVVEMTKWNEKKALLEEFIAASNTPKIKNGDFMPLVKIFKKLVGDSNAVVSSTSVKCIQALATGLRNNFTEAYVKEVISVLV